MSRQPSIDWWSARRLVEYTGRLFRQRKVSISLEVAGIFERLGRSPQSWQARLEKLTGGRLLGRFVATACEACAKSARAWASGTWSTWQTI